MTRKKKSKENFTNMIKNIYGEEKANLFIDKLTSEFIIPKHKLQIIKPLKKSNRKKAQKLSVSDEISMLLITAKSISEKEIVQRLLDSAINLEKGFGSSSIRGKIFFESGLLYLKWGDTKTAKYFFTLTLKYSGGEKSNILSNYYLSLLYLHESKAEKAITSLGNILSYELGTDYYDIMGNIYLLYGIGNLFQNKKEEALVHIIDSLKYIENSSNPGLAVLAKYYLSHILLNNKRNEDSVKVLDIPAELADYKKDDFLYGLIHFNKARAYFAQKEFNVASKMLNRALESFKKIKLYEELAQCILLKSQIYFRMRNPKLAKEYFLAAKQYSPRLKPSIKHIKPSFRYKYFHLIENI